MRIKSNKILYIHGFKSSSNSMTLQKIKNRYGYIFDFIAPDLNGDVDKSIKIINEIIEVDKPRMIIGSSLGGFYALVCDSKDIPILVVNPCINPSEHLKQYIGNGITEEEVEKFGDYDVVSSIKSKGNKVSAILCPNDEILGDTHLKLFEKIRGEEEKGKKVYICKSNFGHRAYPYGIVDICDFIYETIIAI